MNDLDAHVVEKLEHLRSWFLERDGSIVAFSGGVDSALVLYLARKFQGKERAIGVISNSESLKTSDFNLAVSFCELFDIHLEVIKTNELSDVRYSANPVNRCFFCKDHLFQDLHKIKAKFPQFEILSGTNSDDLGDYRPGLEAGKINSVISPLVDCKITKEDVRTLAKHFNLPNWNKPASPCLSSRIPYSQEVTLLKLRQIEAAEELLNTYGFEDVRVRHYGSYGKIEVLKADFDKLMNIEQVLRVEMQKIGFDEIKLDQEGLVSGKLNRVLNVTDLKMATR
jgi:pyridinium-3,5-biscarboxylic acid mononucleotide sulfurtransferase